MRIKTIVFGDYTDASFPKLESVINESFAAVTGGEDTELTVFDSVRPGLPEIAAALKSNDIIVMLTSDKLYHEAKRCICGAFKFPMIHSEAVLNKLKTVPNSERYMMHALMPKNATPFILSDGFFPGFAIRSKSQCLIFLPFSEDRTFITMKKFVFPYIRRVYGLNLPNFNDFEVTYAAKTLEKQLEGSDIQVAVANTNVCKYIAHAGKKIECFNDHISYAPYDEKRAADEHAATAAAEYYECRFGAAVIEGPKDVHGNFTAKICISNRKTTVVRTMASIKDESHEDFINTIITEFLLMIAEELACAPELTEAEKKALKPKSTIHGIRVLIYALLFAATFFFTYVAASFSSFPLFN